MKHNSKLYSIQRELESDMQTRGVEYYRAEVRKAIEKETSLQLFMEF